MAGEKITLRVEVFGGTPPPMDGVPEAIRTDVYRVIPMARARPATWAFCLRHTPLTDGDVVQVTPVLREKAEALAVGWALGRLGCDDKVMVEWWQEGT